MYKILIVDDEPNVRQGISMMIPWDEIDCQVIGEAEDGDDGLSKIMTLSPDIVIADIKMPGKTGIEMTQAAKALGFGGKIIILSGYSDFTYAKEAIALGVENFILKPVDEDELIAAVKAAGEKIQRESEHSYRQQVGNEYLNEQLIKGLFAGTDEAIANANASYDFCGYMAAIISCKGTPEECDNAYREASGFFVTLTNADAVTVDMNGGMGVLFKGWSRDSIKDALERLYRSMSGDIFICCGEYVDTPSQISRSYSFASELYKNGFIYRHLGIAGPENVRAAGSSGEEDHSAKIFAYMEINDTDKIIKTLDSFFASMQEIGMTPAKARINCITMIMDVRSRLSKSGSDKKADQMITDEFTSKVSESDSLYNMIKEMKELFCNISDSCFGKTTKSTMEKIVQYIRANYNTELRLESLAGIFGYNSAYLGKVFHQYTGENFNNYLDEIRITEAKRLLSDEDYKVYEVAEMVGYSNINYFHNKFKKYVGISPLTFKKMHGKNNEDM